MESTDKVNVTRTRVRNTLPGTEGSFRFSVSSISTTRLDPFCSRLADRVGYGKPVVKNVLGAVGAEVADIISERIYRVKAFGFTFEAAIAGSVPSIDSPAGVDNRPYVAVYVDDELERSPESLKPVSSGDAVASSVDLVLDAETGKANVIVGRRMFKVIGWKLSTELEGEGVVARSEVDSSVAAATVTRNSEGRIIFATLDSVLPAGKATVTVMTRGGDADAELWPVTKSVTIVADETPPVDAPDITRGYSTGHGEGEDDGKVYPGTGFVLIGSGFANALVKITYSIAGQPSDVDVDPEDMTVTDTNVTIDPASAALQEAIQATGTLTFTVTTAAGTDSYNAVVLE